MFSMLSHSQLFAETGKIQDEFRFLVTKDAIFNPYPVPEVSLASEYRS
jgi:hypothetical protein